VATPGASLSGTCWKDREKIACMAIYKCGGLPPLLTVELAPQIAEASFG
jgi:hypothetical protein